MSETPTLRADKVIRPIEELTNLCLRLARAGRAAGLHDRDR